MRIVESDFFGYVKWVDYFGINWCAMWFEQEEKKSTMFGTSLRSFNVVP